MHGSTKANSRINTFSGKKLFIFTLDIPLNLSQPLKKESAHLVPDEQILSLKSRLRFGKLRRQGKPTVVVFLCKNGGKTWKLISRQGPRF